MNSKQVFAWIIIVFVFALSFGVMQNTIVQASENQTNVTTQSNSTVLPTTLTLFAPDLIEVNNSFVIEANYTSAQNPILGIDVCSIEFNQQNYFMSLNMSSGFYYYNVVIEENTTILVTCNITGYEEQAVDQQISIVPFTVINVTNSTQENNTNQNDSQHSVVIDVDQDGFSNETDCNDFNAAVHPNATEIVGNLIDDDCNAASFDSIKISIMTDKSTYAPGESVTILLNATANSETYLTINTPTNVSYVYILSNGTYPITHTYELTSMSGPYTIEAVNYYGDATAIEEISFAVSSTFAVSMDVSDTSVMQGDTISFNAPYSGNIGAVNVIWNMDNGKEVYDKTFTYSYNQSGTYNVVLIATDQGQNQAILSKSITVTPLYKVVFSVTNASGKPVPNATVSFGSPTKKTNITGKTVFLTTNKTYELDIDAAGYESVDQNIKINASTTLNYILKRSTRDIAPIVKLLDPANASTVAQVGLRYSADDDGTLSCTVYISEQGDWWEEKGSVETTRGNTVTVNLDITNVSYYWQVECTDEDDNVGYSPIHKFTVSDEQKNQKVTAQSSAAPEGTYTVVQDVYKLIPDFDTYSPDEKKVVDYLDLDVIVKDAQRKLDMANRDLYALRSETDLDTFERKQKEILNRIEDIRSTTPLTIRVVDKKEFVKYATDEDVENHFVDYLRYKNAALSKKEREQLLEQNKLLQKKATIQTQAFIVDMEYIDGTSSEITLVVSSAALDNTEKTEDLIIFFPQSITGDIVFKTAAATLEKNVAYELDSGKSSQIVYTISKKIALNTIPQIKTLLLTTTLREGTNQVTGFALFDRFGFSKNNVTVFFVQLVIVGLLLGVYLYYRFSSSNDDFDGPMHPFVAQEHMQPITQQINFTQPQIYNVQETSQQLPAKTQSKLQYMYNLIAHTKLHIQQQEWHQAAYGFHEIKFLYDLLEENQKEMFTQDLHDMLSTLTKHHILELYNQAVIHLAHNELDLANEQYEHMQEEFEKLSVDDQHEVYPKCCEIALHLKHHETA